MYHSNMEANIEKVVLERLKFAVRSEMDSLDLMSPVEINHMIDFMGRKVAYQFQTYVYGQRLNKVKYPANWKESFKERWFPEWLLKKYPVKYSYIQLAALYPQLHLPSDQYPPIFHAVKMKEPYGGEN